MNNIEQKILQQGYINVTELNRAWIPAQILRHGKDFDKYFLKTKPYSYQWNVLLSELKRTAEKDPTSADPVFFSEKLIVPMIDHYRRTIKTPLSKSVIAAMNATAINTSQSSRIAALSTFVRIAPMPKNMPKCPEWISAFKANGSYHTMLSLIKFNNCHLCRDGKSLNMYESIGMLNKLVSYNDPNLLYDIMTEFLRYNYVHSRLAVQ